MCLGLAHTTTAQYVTNALQLSPKTARACRSSMTETETVEGRNVSVRLSLCIFYIHSKFTTVVADVVVRRTQLGRQWVVLIADLVPAFRLLDRKIVSDNLAT